ncbi:hypothetical protein SEPCBS119000_005241 [Sporothrix epigloea]|uniref:F-box domain-containing protein n=1 Tax=Sporothrix epigloea TaxID=1892477 RepID=A0ABP0DWR0_9PEZI
MAISLPDLPSPATPVVSWQDAGYRCPRPGFFLGDDGAMSASRVLAAVEEMPPSHDLGRLQMLPLELLHQIVDELAETDIRALVALRNCSRAGAAVVDSFRDFATVAAFPRALGALVCLATDSTCHLPPGTSSSSVKTTSGAFRPVSVRALAACLRTTSCASCLRRRTESIQREFSEVNYGDYIYLLRPERVCYPCFRSQPEYLPVARFASAGNTEKQQYRDLVDSQPHLVSIRAPPGRYGVLARLTQPVNLFDRQQVEEAAGKSQGQDAVPDRPRAGGQPLVDKRAGSALHVHAARPDPLRYAAVIPGPYWAQDDGSKSFHRPTADSALDRGYACRACAQTDRKMAGHAGWADPLAVYTRQGLARHLADPRFGGRVLKRRVGMAEIYEHDAPRQGHFPPPVEFGATADLARRYEAVILVPQGSVTGSRP